MNGIWYYFIAFVAIWVFALSFKDKLTEHNVEVNFPILMWKTKRLRGFIDRIANLSPRFWKWYMNVGIVISFGFMILMAVSLIYSLNTVMQTPSVGLVIPGVDIPGSPIFIPFLYGFIGLITVLVVHEFSHGILARVENVNIKSIGLLLAAIIPGAFVEPDEEEVKGISNLSKLRIYAAGSMGNLMLAVVALLILTVLSSFFVPMVFYEDGVVIDRVLSDTPADGVLESGMVLKSINNQSFNSSSQYLSVMSTLKPGGSVHVVSDRGSVDFTLGTNPNNDSLGYMGIQTVKHYSLNDDWKSNVLSGVFYCVFPIIQALMWIFFLNFAVGTFNLLPMKPLDGGLMLETLLSYKFSESTVRPVMIFISYLFLIIIFFSLIMGFLGGLL